MNALLEKFDEVVIENNTRLVESDRSYCEGQHKLYITVLEHYRNMFAEVQRLQKKDDDFYSLIDAENSYDNTYGRYKTYEHKFVEAKKGDFAKIVINVHNKFIEQINSYFRRKYNVTIDGKEFKNYVKIEEPKAPDVYSYYGHGRMTDEEKDQHKAKLSKYKLEYESYLNNIINAKLNYDPIIDDIFLSLGGFSFKEKVEREIKDDAKKAAINSYRNTTYYTLKNSKISFEHLTLSGKCNIFNRYEISLDRDEYKAILRALTYFNSDGASTATYDSWARDFIDHKKKEEDGIYDTHDVSGHSVTHFKFFKNGKFEVTFNNHSTALKFAREFLGYTE